MASNAQGAKPRDASSSKNGVAPEEEQLQHALKHLDLLLLRARDIRTTIPRMLSDMSAMARNNPDSPEVLFGEVVEVMKKAGTEIQDFTVLYTNDESKKILEQAKKSIEVNPLGISTWRSQDQPEWADVLR
ncbi:hypothetical protein GGR50DRAFT_658664 [Xylaria sp. CBS 124048]|nr:hypothetical protein GGR50DRAFT_658664 [Xylaria sp. CBS 124048]